jgi:Tol biopolymer transport system component
VSTDSTGNPASAGSTNSKPSVSGNGQFIAFRSTATNFGATGTQIYLRDTQGNQTILVSKDNSVPSTAGDNPSDSPSISDDGCFVAFASAAANLGSVANQIYGRGPLAPAGCAGTEQTFLVSRNDTGNPANSGAGTTLSPSVNGNAQFIAFASSATNLISPPPGNSQIYVRALP